MKMSLLIIAALMAVQAQPVPPVAREVRRVPAAEAHQGVASDGRHVYAVSNHAIGKYDAVRGTPIARWDGDPALFPHINSCAVAGRRLACAASNYPQVPQTSSVEFFDTKTMRHTGSRALGPGRGSLTVMMPKEGKWWGIFANYDTRGGEPGRDHRYTQLVRFDDQFRQEAAWLFPKAVLERIAPRSISGAVWSVDGTRLYVTGHDRPELYVLELPEAGATLRYIGTVTTPTGGQAIALDPAHPDLIWSIDRDRSDLVASRLP